MKTDISFAAEARDDAGTGTARALRRKGRIPAIIYGAGIKDPVKISLESREIEKEYHKGFFFNRLMEIKAGSKSYHVIPKDLQLHPVTDFIRHADFYSVTKDSKIKVLIPVKFLNQSSCVGIKRGGALNVVRHQVEVFCTPENIPNILELDIKTAEIGDSLHISQISLPEGVEPTITDRDFTIATIAGRLKQEEEVTAAVSEDGEESAEEGKEGGEENAEAKSSE